MIPKSIFSNFFREISSKLGPEANYATFTIRRFFQVFLFLTTTCALGNWRLGRHAFLLLIPDQVDFRVKLALCDFPV